MVKYQKVSKHYVHDSLQNFLLLFLFLLAAAIVKNSHILSEIYFRVILKYATTHNHLQTPTTPHNHSQPPTTIHNYPQPPTATRNYAQALKSSTTFHNYLQPPTSTQKTTQRIGKVVIK